MPNRKGSGKGRYESQRQFSPLRWFIDCGVSSLLPNTPTLMTLAICRVSDHISIQAACHLPSGSRTEPEKGTGAS